MMKRTRLAALVWAFAVVLLVGTNAGSAASRAGSPPVSGAELFKHICNSSRSLWVNCGAVVVTDAAGTPLAGSSPPSGALSPGQLHSAYNLPATAASGGTLAIVDAYDDPMIESDLAAFSSYYGLPPCTTANGCFRKVDQRGGTSYPATNAGWSLEIALDVETAHAMCQNCRILLVEANSSMLADLGAAENEAVALGADAISNSWGAREYSGELNDQERYFNHPGVAITASTGDNGYGVQFPAASDYVTAVGGTTLSLNADGSYRSETTWNGTGSGCSGYVPKPAWQHDGGCSRRTVGDVAADADPNTGAAVFDSVPYNGQTGWFQVGGTSLASPIVAAAYMLAGNTGAVNDASGVYGRAAYLHDITTGNNSIYCGSYLCKAGVGYDGPTGLGTPNGTAAFGSGSAPPPPAQDFSLGVSPGSRTVTAGSGTTFTISLTRTGGFGGTVALSVAGLPTGATAGFSPSSLDSSTSSSTLTVTTSSTVAAGTYSLSITGTSGSLVHSIPASLAVQSASTTSPDFSLGVSPSSRTVTAGTGTTYTVSSTSSGGFSGTISLGTSGLPVGTSASFTPSSLGSSSSSTLTISTSSGLAAGSYPFTITGTSGSLQHSIGATLVVQAQQSQSADFAISVSPASATVPSTGTSTFQVTITPIGGFSAPVTLSAGFLPPSVSVSFSPNPTLSTSTLTVTTNGLWFVRGGVRITITGTGGGHTHSTTLTISL